MKEKFRESRMKLSAPPAGTLITRASLTQAQKRCDVFARSLELTPDAGGSRVLTVNTVVSPPPTYVSVCAYVCMHACM